MARSVDRYKLNVAGILKGSMADGEGIRNVIFTQGCRHHCPGCHNPQTWKMRSQDSKRYKAEDLVMEVIEDGVDITISGGDPFEQPCALGVVLRLLKKWNKNIWVYTGYTYEEIQKDPFKSYLLNYIDVLVDGKYEKDKPETKRMCGSTNQRIIYLNNGEIENIL